MLNSRLEKPLESRVSDENPNFDSFSLQYTNSFPESGSGKKSIITLPKMIYEVCKKAFGNAKYKCFNQSLLYFTSSASTYGFCIGKVNIEVFFFWKKSRLNFE
jgi:hypothetical protein